MIPCYSTMVSWRRMSGDCQQSDKICMSLLPNYSRNCQQFHQLPTLIFNNRFYSRHLVVFVDCVVAVMAASIFCWNKMFFHLLRIPLICYFWFLFYLSRPIFLEFPQATQGPGKFAYESYRITMFCWSGDHPVTQLMHKAFCQHFRT